MLLVMVLVVVAMELNMVVLGPALQLNGCIPDINGGSGGC
jgi:hypothetical protein